MNIPELLIVIVFIMILLLCLTAPAGANDEVAIRTIAYEASGEPLDGQVAVACVIRNRAHERGQTVEEVCFAPHQFSCWRDGKPTQSRKLTEKELETAATAWELSKDRPFPANLYHAKGVTPYWAYAPSVKKLCAVGSHVFYKEIR